MITVAKVLLTGPDDKILVLFRSESHPRYGHDADFPGGEVEDNETSEAAAVRELFEETGIRIAEDNLQQVYARDIPGKRHIVYECQLANTPKDILLSWEHESYGWLSRDGLLRDDRFLRSKDEYCKTVLMALR